MKRGIQNYRIVLIVVIAVIFLLAGLTACDDKEPSPSANGDNIGDTGKISNSVVMTINGYEITESVYKIVMYNEAVGLQSESDGNVSDDEYDEWLLNFFFTEIDGRMPFDIIRERTIKYLRKYVYLIQGAKDAGIELDPGDITDITTDEIIKIGEDYNSNDPDEYFVSKYEVTEKQYMDYASSKVLIERYIESEAVKQDIPDAEIAAYKEEYKDHFLVKTIRSIFLKASTETEMASKMTLALDLKSRIINGSDMKSLVAQYSEDGTTNEGIFTYSKDENDYPVSILDWLYTAKKGDVEVIEADGIYVLKCEESVLSSEADLEAKKDLGKEKLNEKAAQESEGEKYTPVLSEDVYNSYNTLPGDLIPGENSVG